MRFGKNIGMASISVIVTCLAVVPAVAQSGAASQAKTAAEDQSDGDIVVTATRIAERASRVPISISALSKDKLDQQAIKSVEDLQRMVPGLQLSSGTRTIAIRGISSSAGAPTTGVYINDTPFQMLNIGVGTQNTLPIVFDLDRVEVLRGPQGTLFGAGAQGGVVRYITPEPSLSGTSVYGRTEVGFIQDGGQDFEGGVALGTPIIEDKIGMRISAFYRRTGGWVDQYNYQNGTLAQRNANDGEQISLRGAMKIALTDRLTVTPALQYQRTYENSIVAGSSTYFEALSDPDKGVYRSAAGEMVPNRDRWFLPSLKATYDLGPMELTSSTSWFSRRQTKGYDGPQYMARRYNSPRYPRIDDFGTLVTAEGIRFPLADYSAQARVHNRQESFTQEVRLQSTDASAPLTWVAGVFYANNRMSNLETIADPNGESLTKALFGKTYQGYWGQPLYQGIYNYWGIFDVKDTQLAVFGEATLTLLDRLKLTAGARYADIKFKFDNLSTGPLNGGQTTGAGNSHEKPFAPRVSIGFQADPNNLFYATVAKGYRLGGGNAPIPATPCAADFALLGINGSPGSYAGDKTWNYEIGAKNKLFGRLNLATSAYYIKWSGIQQAVRLNSCGYRYIDNVGAAESYGADIQADLRVSSALEFNLTAGYTNAKNTKSVTTSSGAILVDNGDSLGAPEWTLAVGGQYGFDFHAIPMFLRADYQHAAPFAGLTTNLNSATSQYDKGLYKLPSTNYVTARLGADVGDWKVSLFVDNLLNSHDVLNRSHAQLNWPIYLIQTWRPRTFVIQAIFKH